MRVSPWQANKGEVGDDRDEETKTCAKRLFIVKKNKQGPGERKEKVGVTYGMMDVTRKLEGVTLTLVEQNETHEEGNVEEGRINTVNKERRQELEKGV